MTRLMEILLITLGLVLLAARFVLVGALTAGLPAFVLVGLAVVSGLVRTAALMSVFPLVVLAYVAMRVADAVGDVVPAPRWPRLVEVTSR